MASVTPLWVKFNELGKYEFVTEFAAATPYGSEEQIEFSGLPVWEAVIREQAGWDYPGVVDRRVRTPYPKRPVIKLDNAASEWLEGTPARQENRG